MNQDQLRKAIEAMNNARRAIASHESLTPDEQHALNEPILVAVIGLRTALSAAKRQEAIGRVAKDLITEFRNGTAEKDWRAWGADMVGMLEASTQSATSNTKSGSERELLIGGKYNWKGQSERLIFLGRNWSGNGYWNQFALVEKPTVVWCEVLDADLPKIEETSTQQAAPSQGAGELTPEFLADLVPQTATILELKDGSRKTCFTYAEVKQFATALLEASAQREQPAASKPGCKECEEHRRTQQDDKEWREDVAHGRKIIKELTASKPEPQAQADEPEVFSWNEARLPDGTSVITLQSHREAMVVAESNLKVVVEQSLTAIAMRDTVIKAQNDALKRARPHIGAGYSAIQRYEITKVVDAAITQGKKVLE